MPKSSYHSANSLRAFHLLVVTRGVSSTEGSILKRTMVLLVALFIFKTEIHQFLSCQELLYFC